MGIIKLGIIGLGNMGLKHLANTADLPYVEAVAVCDSDSDKLAHAVSEFKVKPYSNAYKMISSAGIDAVIIATPHYEHTPLAIAAFEAGLHVLAEKPVAVHKADAEKMIAAHKKHSDLKFAVMFNQRTVPAHKKIKSLIEKGDIGEIRRINWIITTWYRSQHYYDSGGWRATWKGEGGGVLLNQCPHQLDLFQWFFGMPEKVWAQVFLGKYHNIEVEDDVSAVCTFKNGATGVFITTTGEAPGTNRLEIIGDNGQLIFENGQIRFRRLEVPVSEHIQKSCAVFAGPDVCNIEIPVPDAGKLTQHQEILANFADAVINGAELTAAGDEGIKSLELGNAMLLSGLKKKEVVLPMDSGEYLELLENLIFESEKKKQERR